MSSLCLTRSISVESQDDFYSPSIDLGKDFEYLIRRCIAEKMAREYERQLSDAFGNDQSEAGAADTVGAASLDRPLDSETENETSQIKCTHTNDDENGTTENLDISQHEEKPCNTQKFPEKERTEEQTVQENKDMTASDIEAANTTGAEVEPNSPGRPKGQEERECSKKNDSDHDDSAENDELFAEFEFPPLVKGRFLFSLFKFILF